MKLHHLLETAHQIELTKLEHADGELLKHLIGQGNVVTFYGLKLEKFIDPYTVPELYTLAENILKDELVFEDGCELYNDHISVGSLILGVFYRPRTKTMFGVYDFHGEFKILEKEDGIDITTRSFIDLETALTFGKQPPRSKFHTVIDGLLCTETKNFDRTNPDDDDINLTAVVDW